MTKEKFFRGTTGALRFAFGGFVIALLGVVAGFGSFYFNERWLSLAAFGITVIGVLIGFSGIAYGWVHHAKPAVKGSIKAAAKLRSSRITGSGLAQSHPSSRNKKG